MSTSPSLFTPPNSHMHAHKRASTHVCMESCIQSDIISLVVLFNKYCFMHVRVRGGKREGDVLTHSPQRSHDLLLLSLLYLIYSLFYFNVIHAEMVHSTMAL